MMLLSFCTPLHAGLIARLMSRVPRYALSCGRTNKCWIVTAISVAFGVKPL
jgi:hypothetical protein